MLLWCADTHDPEERAKSLRIDDMQSFDKKTRLQSGRENIAYTIVRPFPTQASSTKYGSGDGAFISPIPKPDDVGVSCLVTLGQDWGSRIAGPSRETNRKSEASILCSRRL